MSYQYEFFFSYKRDPESDAWHRRVSEKLVYWLKQELNTLKVRVFFDTEEIKSGDRWQSRIADALKTSKCLVCIWSPVYFQSKWCVSEWATFDQRGRAKKLDLVVPARYHDGEHYPQPAREIQSRDFGKFASTMPRFWDTELAVEFEPVLKAFATEVAQAIRSAPDFDPDFPIVEVSDDLIAQKKPIARVADG